MSRPNRLFLSIGLTALLFLPGGAVQAQENGAAAEKLPELEREIEKRTESQKERRQRVAVLNREIGGLSQELIDTANAIQEQEDRVAELEERVTRLAAREREKSANLKDRFAQLSTSLAALQRLSQRRDIALLAASERTIDMVRTASLLGAVVPPLRAEAARLGADIADLRETRDSLETEQAFLKAERDSLRLQRRELDKLIARKRGEEEELKSEMAREEARLEELAQEAADMRALIARLEAREAAADSALTIPLPARDKPFSELRGKLPLPVRGTIVQLFDTPNDLGLPEKGLRIETRADAQVIAPYDGKVLYAGPFRTYGKLLIIAHGEGYHTLLAGLERIDARVGQWLYAGEPVGQMGPAEEPVLYVELRRQGRPIDPLVWIAKSERKVSG